MSRSRINIPHQFNELGEETKLCSKCKQWLLLSSFTKDSQKKDGFRTDCKNCLSKTRKQDLIDSPEKYKIWRRNTYSNTRNHIFEYQKQYYKKNKSIVSKKQKLYYEKNKDKYKLTQLKWRQDNKEKKKEIDRLRRESNRDRIRETGKIYTKLDEVKTKHRARNRIRKLKMKGGDKFTIQIRDEMLSIQNYLCPYCGEPLEKGDDGTYIYHLDHIIPLCKGGPHLRSNRQLLHPSCNCRKQNN